MEELRNVPRERRPPRPREAEAPAERGVKLREDERLGDPAPEGEPERDRLPLLLAAAHLPANPERPPEDLPLQGRARLHPGEDPRVDLLVHPRHAEDEVGADLPEVVGHLVEALGERRREPQRDPDERFHPRVGVREGQKQEVHVTLRPAERLRQRPERGDVVAVGLHDALRRPRRARRVDDRRHIGGGEGRDPVGERRLQPLGALTTEASERLPPERAAVAPPPVAAGHHHDLLEPAHLAADLEDSRLLAAILDDQRLGAGVVHDVGDEVRRVRGINRDRDATGREDCEVRLDPLGPTRREERHGVATLAAKRDQTERQLADDLAQLPPRERLPASVPLKLLGGPVTTARDPTPEELRQRVVRHRRLPLPYPRRRRKLRVSVRGAP